MELTEKWGTRFQDWPRKKYITIFFFFFFAPMLKIQLVLKYCAPSPSGSYARYKISDCNKLSFHFFYHLITFIFASLITYSPVTRDIISKIESSWILYGCVIYHSTRQWSYFQNNLVVKRKYGAVFQKSRSKVKNHFSHKNSLNTKFHLESLFHSRKTKNCIFGFPYSIFYLKRLMSSKNNCSVQIYVFS